MIQQVTIRNFKCLRDATIDLERFTVFVGANGSGKTSILQAVDLLCRTFQESPAHSVGYPYPYPHPLDAEFKQHRAYGTSGEVELSCASSGGHFRYRTFKPLMSPLVYAQAQQGEIYGTAFTKDANLQSWEPWKPEEVMLPNPVWLRLDPNHLRSSEGVEPDYQNDPDATEPDPRTMLPNGTGLHGATAAMALEDPDRWQKLQEDLRRIVPSIRRLRHTPQAELLFDTSNGKGLKAHQVSEGTLLTLGLLAAIHGVNKPGVLLLDDLDRALHPKAQRELIELLRGVQVTNPEIQILGSTHSPYMLDEMKPEEVLVTSLREDGTTACEPLTNHPKFEKWKNEFHPGEMWSFFGEKWVADGEGRADETKLEVVGK